jgi:isocitrate dehydrogenase kinase/phosphatase
MSTVESIARTILEGFDHHYSLFRVISARAKQHFERADWLAARQDGIERIRMYDLRVRETVRSLEKRHPESSHNYDLWPQVKRAYIGLLMDHLQPECAETFYNSVACSVLHRTYYRNDYIFWRPTLNTEHLEGSQSTYRCYYPEREGLRRSLLRILVDTQLANPFQDLRRDVRYLEQAVLSKRARHWDARPNYQFQVLNTLFIRNKAAYIIGREINGDVVRPLVIPVLQDTGGAVYADTLLANRKDVAVLFSFARAYFMVDTEVPAACVHFLLSIMPRKSQVDLYALLGLQKHAKTLFYREMQHHLRHSSDNFEIAPGIPGLVMLVFTLPSFNFVFKIIKDKAEPPKKTNREEVKQKYQLVKVHDRVGRLADTLEYSNVAIPLERVDAALMEQLRSMAAKSIELDGDRLVIKHVYIERRMTPLNEYLANVGGKLRFNAIIDYGFAIRDLAGANIFPGDMMQKNFGVTRNGRVVFYDYDEICYVTDCRFRRIPPSSSIDDDMSDQPWFSIQDNDVFPETFGSFFFPDPQARKIFEQEHAELMDPKFWNRNREMILAGGLSDVFPYAAKKRFGYRFATGNAKRK